MDILPSKKFSPPIRSCSCTASLIALGPCTCVNGSPECQAVSRAMIVSANVKLVFSFINQLNRCSNAAIQVTLAEVASHLTTWVVSSSSSSHLGHLACAWCFLFLRHTPTPHCLAKCLHNHRLFPMGSLDMACPTWSQAMASWIKSAGIL